MAKRSSILDMEVGEIISGIRQGDRVMMGRAITLVESKRTQHQSKGNTLVSELLKLPTNSFHVAISGSPGVGKSTFIEKLGLKLVDEGHKVAVLTIDPSSDINKGSILGDKTRMEKLSTHPNSFIRPSPAGDFLGGVAWRTREAICICAAAGYDIILVETVGVGQSEFKVKDMVDCFFLLLSPGGGDELQGIKKGIIEIADILAVNKCDGDFENSAKQTQKEYNQALHLYPSRTSGWKPKVITTSSITGDGIQEAWQVIQAFQKHMRKTGQLEQVRKSQNLKWFQDHLTTSFQQYIYAQLASGVFSELQKEVQNGAISPLDAAEIAKGRLLK